MNDDLFSGDMPALKKAQIALTRASVAPAEERLIRARHAHWFGLTAMREALRARDRHGILRASQILGHVYCLLATCEHVDVWQEMFGKDDK